MGNNHIQPNNQNNLNAQLENLMETQFSENHKTNLTISEKNEDLLFRKWEELYGVDKYTPPITCNIKNLKKSKKS